MESFINQPRIFFAQTQGKNDSTFKAPKLVGSPIFCILRHPPASWWNPEDLRIVVYLAASSGYRGIWNLNFNQIIKLSVEPPLMVETAKRSWNSPVENRVRWVSLQPVSIQYPLLGNAEGHFQEFQHTDHSRHHSRHFDMAMGQIRSNI